MIYICGLSLCWQQRRGATTILSRSLILRHPHRRYRVHNAASQVDVPTLMRHSPAM
jgi:hypothetical protein